MVLALFPDQTAGQEGEKMKQFGLAGIVGLATFFVIAGMAYSQSQNPPRYGCQQRFNTLDADHDGKLTIAEFMSFQHSRNNPEQVFDSMDVNGRGYVTKDEFCARRGMGKGIGQGSGTRMNQ